jgi:hypothetical protein
LEKKKLTLYFVRQFFFFFFDNRFPAVRQNIKKDCLFLKNSCHSCCIAKFWIKSSCWGSPAVWPIIYIKMFCIFYFHILACNQMWLNFPMDDPHFWLHHKIDNKKTLGGRDGRTDRRTERARESECCWNVMVFCSSSSSTFFAGLFSFFFFFFCWNR